MIINIKQGEALRKMGKVKFSNVKLAAMSQSWANVEGRPDEQSEEYLTFVKQIGLKYVIVEAFGEGTTYESLLKKRLQIEAAGLEVANTGLGNDHRIILNLPGRDEEVEAHKNFIRNAGKAGYHTIWNHYSGSSVWSTEREQIRSASGRAFDMEKARKDGCNLTTNEYGDKRSGTTGYPDHPTAPWEARWS